MKIRKMYNIPYLHYHIWKEVYDWIPLETEITSNGAYYTTLVHLSFWQYIRGKINLWFYNLKHGTDIKLITLKKES